MPLCSQLLRPLVSMVYHSICRTTYHARTPVCHMSRGLLYITRRAQTRTRQDYSIIVAEWVLTARIGAKLSVMRLPLEKHAIPCLLFTRWRHEDLGHLRGSADSTLLGRNIQCKQRSIGSTTYREETAITSTLIVVSVTPRRMTKLERV